MSRLSISVPVSVPEFLVTLKVDGSMSRSVRKDLSIISVPM